MDLRYYWRPGTLSSLLVLAAAGLCVAAAARAADPGTAAPGASEPGIWQSHQMTFNYLGADPHYSCEGLRDQLQLLLQQAGARLDGPVIAGPCTPGLGQPESINYARLKFSTLKPVGDSAAQSTDTAPGMWHTVLLAPNHPAPYLQGGDCELVQEFKDKVLPMFTTRNIKANLQCAPFQTTGYFFSLSFDVFEPANAPRG